MRAIGQTLTALIAALVVLCSSFAGADAQARSFTYNLDIPSQGLNSALQQFALASRHKLLYRTVLVEGKSSPALKGEFTVEGAVQKLLSGTNLTFEITPSAVVLIKTQEEAAQTHSLPQAPNSSNSRGAASPLAKNIPSNGIRIAQADEKPESKVSHKDEQTVQSTEKPTQFEGVVITGTHIRGVQELPAPSLTFTREEIERTGFATTEELFESLPQNFGEIGSDASFAQEGNSILGVQNSRDRASAIDLRGLGAQSTLTLVNGSRVAGSLLGQVVDISAIPLSFIERTEIVTGGRSAIYGSDAVGGVVNLVMRREFDGAETQVSIGSAEKGGERVNFSQVVGTEFGRGGLVAAYDYQREWALDLVETGLTVPTARFGQDPTRLNVQPDTWRHSLFLAGRFSLNDRVELYTDGFYTYKKYEDQIRFIFSSLGATNESVQAPTNQSDLYRAAVGARIDLSDAWTLDVSGAASSVDTRFRSRDIIDLGPFGEFASLTALDTRATLENATAITVGRLFSIGGITPRTALGVEVRNESFTSLQLPEDAPSIRDETDRIVRSVFAEFFIPLIDDPDGSGTRRLGLSLAGRYDDYSDFGGTFNPQVGVVWEPIKGLTLRGAYSTAFRAPALIQLSKSAKSSTITLSNLADPRSPNGFSPVLQWLGFDPNPGPEEAKSWSTGFDYEPTFAPGARLSLSYFDIEYDERIDFPAIGVDTDLVLVREDRFVEQVNRNPSAAELVEILATDSDDFIDNFTGTAFDPATQGILDVFPDLVVFDNRITNVAVEAVRGLDFILDVELETTIGTLTFGVNATHTLDHERRFTATSPSFDQLNEVGKPVDLRVRANVGLQRGAYGGFVYLNYVDSYADPYETPVGEIGSWTTIDLALRLDGSRLADSGFLRDFSATVSVSNLFDQDPPEFLSSGFGLRYDSTNASGLGRYFTVSFKKRW